MIVVILLLLFASPAFADPKNFLPQAEQPVAARCVTPDGLSYESCGGSLTLNGADGAINDGANDTIKATVKDYTNSNPLTTIIVDTNGDPASIGGGTQYQQGSAATTTDTMTMAGCVRVDTPAVAAGVIDGDRARCIVDSTGRLWVHVGVIDGTVAATQSGTWNIGTLTSITNPVAVTGTFWQATQPVSGTVTVTDGAGALNVIVDSSALPTGAATAANQDGIIKDGTGDTTQANVSSGALHVAQQGTVTVSGTVTVTDGAGALNVICDSGCSGGTQYAEDTVHSSGDTLTLAGVVRQDATAALAADGDRTLLQVDSNGHLKVSNNNPNLAADNSTLSTAKVPVIAGTVSTSAPTWTNGNQSALSLQTDGSVRAAVTNNLTIGTFPDNEPFNVAQMNGVAVSMGVGASGTGTQRVAALLHDGTDTAQVTATAGGSLQVECTSGCGGSGGTSIADDAAFTPGTTSVTPAGAMFDDVTPDSVNEGDAGVLRMSANRNLYTTLRDAAGNERGANVNASNQLSVSVDNALTVTANAGTGTFFDGVIRDGAGDTTQANVSSGRLQVDGSGVTQPVSGTVSITANSAVNVAQINGVTPLMGAGNTGTGSPRVTIATDQAALTGMGVYVEDAGETAGGNLAMAGSVRRDTAASSAGTTGDNATINTDASGLLWTRTIDPCSSGAKTFLPINISTATTTEITPSLAGASTNYYVCSLVLVTAAANNVALVDDDSDGCGSVTSGMAGGTSAASGFNLAANSGMTFGNGTGAVFKTNGTNRVVCLVTSAATQLSGTMTVVAAP